MCYIMLNIIIRNIYALQSKKMIVVKTITTTTAELYHLGCV